LPVQKSVAQTDLPIIRAHSTTADVRDGSLFKKGFWNIDPASRPDTYWADLPRKNHTVTMITDIDSITFDVSFGKIYDFIILLHGKDSCYTRISAEYNGISRYAEPAGRVPGTPDTVPFKLGGSRIYFKGSINGHPDIRIQFDLGAGMSSINERSIRKTGVKFDGKTSLSNSNGTNESPTSSSNRIEIAGLVWDQVTLIRTGNMGNEEDAIIGNSLFENKVIEINYDKLIMVLHDTLPAIPAGYVAYETHFIQHRPIIQAGITVGGKIYTDEFLFDTGRDGNMVLRDNFFRKYPVWDEMKTILNLGNKKTVVVSRLELGGLTFRNLLSPAFNPGKIRSESSNVLGNKLLNHFNVILDNQNGMIWLKPNTLQKNKYPNWTDFRNRGILVLIGLAFLSAAGVLTLRKVRRNGSVS